MRFRSFKINQNYYYFLISGDFSKGNTDTVYVRRGLASNLTRRV